jgi:hypothetical protein
MQRKVYLGCDPGKAGYFTAFDNEAKGEKFKFYPIPKHKVATGKLTKAGKPEMKTEFNPMGFRDLVFQINKDFPNSKFIATMEEVTGRHGWSAQSNFNFGHTAGLQYMVFVMLGAKIKMVKPQKWQSYMGAGYDKVKVPSSTGKTMVNDTKAFAEKIATTEYPDIDFKDTPRAKKSHDGKIDSFLVCLYGLRTDKE